MTAALSAVAGWVPGTEIYNPEYVALKDRLGRAFEREWRLHPPFPRDEEGRHLVNTETLRLCDSLRFGERGCGSLAVLHKSRADALMAAATISTPAERLLIQHYRTCLAKWTPISAKLALMKAAAISGRRPSAAATAIARDRYRAEKAPEAHHRLIAMCCAEVTDKWRDQAIERIAGSIRAFAERFVAERQDNETPRQFWRRTFQVDQRPAGTAVPRAEYLRLTAAQEAAVHAECMTRDTLANSAFPVREATRSADGLIAEFTAKMQLKLGFLDKRLSTIESRNVRTDGGGSLECDLRVAMHDPQGARFTVRNQIVWSTSIYGRPFMRYPSTFHSIEIPGGRPKRASASEREMNGWFPRRMVERTTAAPGPAAGLQDADEAPVLVEPATRRLASSPRPHP